MQYLALQSYTSGCLAKCVLMANFLVQGIGVSTFDVTRTKKGFLE